MNDENKSVAQSQNNSLLGQQSRSHETEASLTCIDALQLFLCCSAVDIPNESNTLFGYFYMLLSCYNTSLCEMVILLC